MPPVSSWGGREGAGAAQAGREQGLGQAHRQVGVNSGNARGAQGGGFTFSRGPRPGTV